MAFVTAFLEVHSIFYKINETLIGPWIDGLDGLIYQKGSKAE